MINPLAVARLMVATDADQGIDNNSNNSELVRETTSERHQVFRKREAEHKKFQNGNSTSTRVGGTKFPTSSPSWEGSSRCVAGIDIGYSTISAVLPHLDVVDDHRAVFDCSWPSRVPLIDGLDELVRWV